MNDVASQERKSRKTTFKAGLKRIFSAMREQNIPIERVELDESGRATVVVASATPNAMSV